MQGKEFSKEAISLTADSIYENCKMYEKGYLKQSFESYFKAPPSDYFTLANMINHITERVQRISLKALEEKKKKEQESYFQDLTKPKSDIEIENIDKASKEAIEKIRKNLKEPERRIGHIKVGEVIRKRYGW